MIHCKHEGPTFFLWILKSPKMFLLSVFVSLTKSPMWNSGVNMLEASESGRVQLNAMPSRQRFACSHWNDFHLQCHSCILLSLWLPCPVSLVAKEFPPNRIMIKISHRSGQIIIFHQPRFPWNKGISLPQLPFGGPGRVTSLQFDQIHGFLYLPNLCAAQQWEKHMLKMCKARCSINGFLLKRKIHGNTSMRHHE